MQIPQDQLHRLEPMECDSIPPPPSGPHASLDMLDEEHLQTFRRALLNVLSTHVAEFTYAQIIDGLPTEESLAESYAAMLDHPVHVLKHAELCEGFLDRARELRSEMDMSMFSFELHVG